MCCGAWLLLLVACNERNPNTLTHQYDQVVGRQLPPGAQLLGPGRVPGALPPLDVGLDDHEREAGEAIIDTLAADKRVDLVATWRHGSYEIHAARGAVRFRRYLLADGSLAFQVDTLRGQNPVINQSPIALPTLADMLHAGSNPNRFWDRSKPACDYHGAQDPRLRFLSPEAVTYPYPYSRLAAVFDAVDAPDLAVSYAPFYGVLDESGGYGELDVADSRGFLAMYGPGVRPGVYAGAARLQDVAPTVARLLSVPPRPDGRLLRGQDGRVLEEMLNGRAARRVLIINLAGMPLVVFDELRTRYADRYRLINQLVTQGAIASGGLIAPFPSADWPAACTLITGADPGRHGVLDAAFFHHERQQSVTITDQWRDADRLLSPPHRVETIFEALRRGRPGQSTPPLTAALGLLASRGADYATVFGYDATGAGADPRKTGLDPIGDIDQYCCEPALRPVFDVEDNLMQHAVAALIPASGAAPELVMWSLPTFLAAARRYGPYSSCAMRAAWHQLEAVQRVLESLVVVEHTDLTVIFLSDHGLRGVDQTRGGVVIDYLHDLGYAVRRPALHLLYLPTMHVETSSAWDAAPGAAVTISLACTDDDTALPIAGAEVSLLAPGGGGLRAVTDPEGHAALHFAPQESRVVLEVRHPDYNPRQITLGLTPR